MAPGIKRLYRQILDAEYGNKPSLTGDIPLAAVYPNTYKVGMSNLALQWLYGRLNRPGPFFAERIFLPDGELLDIYRKQQVKLRTLESTRPASDTMAWFVTISFENDYLNLARLLNLAGLSPYAEDRAKGQPLIIIGGTAVMLNPEPVANIADVILMGEGSAALTPLLNKLSEYAQGKNRDEFLDSLNSLPFAYVPSKYTLAEKGNRLVPEPGFSEKITVVKEKSIDASTTYTKVFTPDTEFSEKLLIEIYRGCGSRCRFCAAGHMFLPPRQRKYKKGSVPLERKSGQQGTGLVGAGVSSHSHATDWITAGALAGRVGISSLKLGCLSGEDLSRLAKHGAKSVAIAPEAGTERLRRVLNKPFTDQEIAKEAERVIKAGFKNIKLYFMVGLPTETEKDIQGICNLVSKIKDAIMPLWKDRGAAGEISVSVNPFIPKAHTPFQWAPFLKKKDYDSAKKLLREKLNKEGNIWVKFESYRSAKIQAYLSMAGRDAGEIIIDLASGKSFSSAIKDQKARIENLLHNTRDIACPLPWDFVDAGFDGQYLKREFNRGLQGKISPECDVGRCTLCGICE